ncbi:MAG: 4'-phosphopantetheinyl transferase superfamily protein [Anaerolineales bacterium]|nr:4'-phosphopantetheinyl transferase superfamily protein [Anaerolineales bacterium]
MNSLPEISALEPGRVHIWYISLAPEPAGIHSLQEILSDAEQERAARFIHKKDLERWVTAHISLRLILSQYLQQAPETISFTEGPFGKPELQSPASTLQFNLSYCGNGAVLAVADNTPVGIDVQNMPVSFEKNLQPWIASQVEGEWLVSLPDDSLRLKLLQLWVRKEALLKAAGTGLSVEPSSITLPDQPPPLLLTFMDSSGQSFLWSIYDLDEEDDPMVCLAARGEQHSIQQHRWSI